MSPLSRLGQLLQIRVPHGASLAVSGDVALDGLQRADAWLGCGRRLRRLLAAVAVLMLMLTGCTGIPSTPNPPSPMPTPTPGRPLTMLWWGSPQDEDLLREQLARFSTSGTQVNLEVVSPDEVPVRLAQLRDEGKLPDVVRLADLARIRTELSPLNVDAQFPPTLDVALKRSDKLIAVPYGLDVSTVFVNADAFAAAGVELPTTQVPWKTWSQMMAEAERVTAGTKMGAQAAVDVDSTPALNAFFWQFGAYLFGAKTEGVSWPLDSATEALSQLQTMVASKQLANTFSPPPGSSSSPAPGTPQPSPDPGATAQSPGSPTTPASPAPVPPPSARQLFEDAEVPILLSDSSYRPQTSFRSVAIASPCQEACGVVPQASYLASFSKDGAANQLINFLVSAQAQTERAQRVGLLPSRTDVLADFKATTDNQGVFLTELRRVHDDAAVTGYSPATPAATQTVREELAALMSGRQNPEQTAEAIGRGAVQALRQAG